MLLAGKRALVTGAASGIGRATALRFAAEGAAVVVVDINEDGANSTVADILDVGGSALTIRADVGNASEIRNTVASATEWLGGLDVLVSNAASYARGSATEIDEDDWDRTLAVCLKATWLLAKESIPVMRRDGGGSIVVVSSVHAVRGYTGHVAYQAAKAGLVGLTRSMAADFAPDIRVNAILPGAIVTGLWADMTPEEHERAAQACPLLRNGEPDDVAGPIVFLASDMAAYMTGTSLVVDGGLTAVIKTH